MIGGLSRVCPFSRSAKIDGNPGPILDCRGKNRGLNPPTGFRNRPVLDAGVRIRIAVANRIRERTRSRSLAPVNHGMAHVAELGRIERHDIRRCVAPLDRTSVKNFRIAAAGHSNPVCRRSCQGVVGFPGTQNEDVFAGIYDGTAARIRVGRCLQDLEY